MLLGAGLAARAQAAPVRAFTFSGPAVLDRGADRDLARGAQSATAVSFDLRLRGHSAASVEAAAGRGVRLPASTRWRRVELLRNGRRLVVAIGGRRIGSTADLGRPLLRVIRGRARIANLIATDGSRASLLLHRLAAYRLRARGHRLPVVEGSDGRLRYRPLWMRGFWAGALWQAYDRSGHDALFRRWALRATLATNGGDADETHDVGFIYGQSAVAAYRRLCRPSGQRDQALCARLRQTGLRAAASLAALVASNPGAGTLPTRAVGCRTRCTSPQEADTIIDSIMNVDLLLWAAQEGGPQSYVALARRHAHALAALLMRPDGSTIQSVHLDRLTGMPLFFHTHQGLSTASTWSRGQAWAIYGYAQSAATLGDEQLGQVAERAAAYFQRALGKRSLPRWDFDATFGPVDSSAAAIAAAGLERLAAWRCSQGPQACARAERWRALAGRLRRGALGRVRSASPLGRFRGQVFSYGGSTWDENAEFLMGTDYLLEATQ